MSPPIEALGAVGSAAAALPTAVTPVSGISGPGSVSPADPTGFAATLATSLDRVQGLQSESARLAVAAATGDLTDVHDYTIASTQAKVATEVTVAIRNKALDAFSEIMRMQV